MPSYCVLVCTNAQLWHDQTKGGIRFITTLQRNVLDFLSFTSSWRTSLQESFFVSKKGNMKDCRCLIKCSDLEDCLIVLSSISASLYLPKLLAKIWCIKQGGLHSIYLRGQLEHIMEYFVLKTKLKSKAI